MKGVVILTVAAIVGVAACGGEPTAETSELAASTAAPQSDMSAPTVASIEPSTTTIVKTDSGGGVDGPVMYWQQREGRESEAAQITGRLDLDGDCLYVIADWGKHPVLWEYGTKWQADPAAVVLPDGIRVPLGAAMWSGGGYHYADELDSFTNSEDVEALAARCADNEWNEVAVVQGAVEHGVENAYRGGPAHWSTLDYESSRIERNCIAEFACTQIRVDVDGTSVSYDPTTRALTRHVTPPVSAEMPDSYGDLFIELLGPDDVVYLNVDPLVDTELATDLVAVALTVGDAGREIGRWPGVTDRIGDADLVSTPEGIVSVGCCGPDQIRPAPDADVVVTWIARDGQSIVASQPVIRVELDYPTATITRDWSGSSSSWTVELGDPSGQRGAPPMMPTFDGGIITTFPGESGHLVVRGWLDGSTDAVQIIGTLEALEPTGVALITDGERFARVDLFEDRTEYWSGDADIDVGGTGVLLLPGLNEEIANARPSWSLDPAAFANAVAGPLAVNETRSIEAIQTSEFGWTVTVTTGNYFDDSVYGTRLELELGMTDFDGSFRFNTGYWSNVCQPDRGQQEFSPELCL